MQKNFKYIAYISTMANNNEIKRKKYIIIIPYYHNFEIMISKEIALAALIHFCFSKLSH